jgi:hypothetical protein
MQNEIHVIVGRKGSGKTELAKTLINSVEFGNIIWYDTIGEFAQGKSGLPGFEKIKSLKVLRNRLLGWQNKAYRLIGGGYPSFEIVYLPGKYRATVDLAYTWSFLEARYKLTKQPATIVVDESDLFNRGGQPDKTIKDMVMRGRHAALDQFYITQRPIGLTQQVMSQADFWWLFQMDLPSDLDFLKKIIPASVVDELPNLPIGTGIFYDRKVKEIKKIQSR